MKEKGGGFFATTRKPKKMMATEDANVVVWHRARVSWEWVFGEALGSAAVPNKNTKRGATTVSWTLCDTSYAASCPSLVCVFSQHLSVFIASSI